MVLETLCFDLDIEIPHPIALHLLKDWNGKLLLLHLTSAPKEIAKAVYNYCHDAFVINYCFDKSMSTSVCLQHSTRTIAAAAIYAATSEESQEILPANWWTLLAVSESTLKCTIYNPLH